MIHVAILKPGYIQAILDGAKTIESRLTKTRQAPHGQITPGERVFFKASGGAFMATAITSQVRCSSGLKPADIERLRTVYGDQIGGDNAYWQAKQASRFATLITLGQVAPIKIGPPYKPAHMKAWYVLDEARDPLRIARLLH